MPFLTFLLHVSIWLLSHWIDPFVFLYRIFYFLKTCNKIIKVQTFSLNLTSSGYKSTANTHASVRFRYFSLEIHVYISNVSDITFKLRINYHDRNEKYCHRKRINAYVHTL